MRARLSALADDLKIVAVHLLLPDDLREGLPAIDRGWVGFDTESEPSMTGITSRGSREKLLGKVIERLRADDAALDFATVAAPLERASTRPPLVFMHSTLPHGPSRFLPDGRGYPINRKGYPGFALGRWTDRQWLVDQSFQRHVLQVQYADALVGGLLDTLREVGLYDRAVILLTADHGVSFRAGQPRRRLTSQTIPDLVLVPFFVKWPGQRSGEVDDRAVRSVDALPTLAKAARVRVPWRTDGIPADERPVDPSTPIDVMDDGQPRRPQPLGTLLDAFRAREAVEARLLRHGVYRIGPRPDLIGRRIADPALAAAGPRATVDAPGAYRAIAEDAPNLPVLVTGDVTGLKDNTPIAVAIDGRIQTTTRVFHERGRPQYAALVPPDSLRPGSHTVAVLHVQPGDRLRTIGAVPATSPLAIGRVAYCDWPRGVATRRRRTASFSRSVGPQRTAGAPLPGCRLGHGVALAHDPPAGDDEPHVVERGQVGARISADDERVGGVARVEPAELARPTYERRARGGGRA